MALRRWQSNCLKVLLKKYISGKAHCLVTATPGAGKTFLTAALAQKLFELDLIDFVICIAPSVDVAEGFRLELATLTGRRMDGRLGSSGETRTYHSLAHLDREFWSVLNNRVLIVFDEIHHCGGADKRECNAWGLTLLEHVKDKATYTLSLSGTPWRSDRMPVTMNEYCDSLDLLTCDYTYSLSEAVYENVCRIPQITAIDNSELHYESADREPSNYPSISELLHSGVPFQEVLENEWLASHLLGRGVKQLSNLRRANPKAAGLIVATNIEHAYRLSSLLNAKFAKEAVIVTSEDQKAREALSAFREGSAPWIISVGMISEGTNIPRLQVCCYLSRIKTELYFRQVLGRILRVTEDSSQFAYFYMLAEPNLVKFARRVSDDLPEENVLIKRREYNQDGDPLADVGTKSSDTLPHDEKHQEVNNPTGLISVASSEDSQAHDHTDNHFGGGCSDPRPHGQLSIYGEFLEKLIALE